MKLNPLQWFWMAAVIVLLAGLLLDVAGVINPPSLLWLTGSGLLLLTGKIMPTMAELKRLNRRG